MEYLDISPSLASIEYSGGNHWFSFQETMRFEWGLGVC
jgi:hypothetical protein